MAPTLMTTDVTSGFPDDVTVTTVTDNRSQTDASPGYLMMSWNVMHIQVTADITVMMVALAVQNKCMAGPIASPHRP